MKFLIRSYRPLAVALVVIALFIVALPTFAAPGGTFIGFYTNESGCYVDVVAQVEDAGYYAINMWDDGNFRAGAGADVPAGGTITVRFTIGGVILQGAAGIGVYLEDAIGLSSTQTFDADGSAQLWSDTVGTDCANAGFTWGASVSVGIAGSSCPNPLPAGTLIYNVPDGARAYYDDDPNTYTGFDLSPGTWHILEFGPAFAKVWIDCNATPIYIPIENVLR